MDRFAYLKDLAAAQTTPLQVRVWENKNVIIHRNLQNKRGLITEVWDAWLHQVLRPFGGFETVIEIDRLDAQADIRFFSENDLAAAIHYLLHVDETLTVS
ncbi:hypothetical protein [Lacticaseibacillus mingshuiensis]|uniref:Uncharacterized protein n=2 Tax=Lacticaseibacillus mingshuiensis TaxID=2799574 RepID=A0ABW4CGY3_9LACO|nr:hypothetical protein [Lacticaseibacillus mingshuiensis]